ncbi:hypothetical protein C1646_804429 [Rhizophagus diaphanus]|nr:hypothetical protein C1646_804429 [Rhizophagus diaphanus] [Rhizophagus sp. MUCL 43196]
MDAEDNEFTWNNFRNGLDHEFERSKLKDYSITKRKHIDHVWDSLRQTIMKVAKNHIKHRNVVKNKLNDAPEKKLAVYFDLRYIINRIQEIRSYISHFHDYYHELDEVRKQLRIVFKLKLNIMEQEQIIANIKKRYNNYKED